MKILLLSPYPPYPPRGGGAMRIYQIIRGLAQRHSLTCLTFVPDAAAEQALAPLRDLCRLITVRGPAPRSLLRRAWTTLASPFPDMALRNASPAFRALLCDLVAREHVDIVQAESIEMASYLIELARNAGASSSIVQRPLLALDQFNAEYVLQKRAAITDLRAAFTLADPVRRGAGGVYSLIQWIKLAHYERRILQICDAVIVVSEEDRKALERLGGTCRAVVPNGVDTTFFSRETLTGDHRTPLSYAAPVMVFSGTLDFRPNIDAIVWFIEAVLPRIHARRPDVQLLVVGRRPAPILRRLAEQGRLILTGEVSDVRPFLAGAAVYIVPMRIGGGIRLKVLEAFALEAPVVSTTLGVEGIAGLRDGVHCLLADTPQQFADAVVRLLDDPALRRILGAAGRRLARAEYDWKAIIPRLEAVYQR
ncbi:glycosyltransferase family 4 protein [Roseiflexus sp. RS-1]|uniref:glycosyltransferase family 4 protein n=1 Tax=Roseiflexus sp. (strain RS-1) TaxID=357808 RepID=UPI0001533FD6|nr:glycosyltransferase family 4 protein [Roseiflexus sp. RS-1]ABQ91949.1 glycosyl transferase, group 1 [Roseiflexus sp. RS-1]